MKTPKVNIKQFYTHKISNNLSLIKSLSLIASSQKTLEEIAFLKEENKMLKSNFKKEKKKVYVQNKENVKKIIQTQAEFKKVFKENKRKYDSKTFAKMKLEYENLLIRKKAEKIKKYRIVYGTSSGKTWREKNSFFIKILVICIILLLFIVPFWSIISYSTKTGVESVSDEKFATFIPSTGKGAKINYDLAFKNLEFWKSIWTTLGLTVISNILILAFASMAAWQLVRNDRWWSKVLFYIFITAMILPFQAIMIPLISQMQKMQLRNTMFGTILAYMGFGMALSIFMLHGFLKSIPKVLEESAAISGMGPFRIFYKIVLPLLKNTFITIMVLNVMWIWNDYLLPSLMLGSQQTSQTLQVKLFDGLVTETGQDLKAISAGAVILVIPPIIYFTFTQKKMISGITNGAIK